MPLETGIAPENLSIADIDPTAIYSVTELSRHIKDALAANPKFNNLLLKGEISNFPGPHQATSTSISGRRTASLHAHISGASRKQAATIWATACR